MQVLQAVQRLGGPAVNFSPEAVKPVGRLMELFTGPLSGSEHLS